MPRNMSLPPDWTIQQAPTEDSYAASTVTISTQPEQTQEYTLEQRQFIWNWLARNTLSHGGLCSEFPLSAGCGPCIDNILPGVLSNFPGLRRAYDSVLWGTPVEGGDFGLPYPNRPARPGNRGSPILRVPRVAATRPPRHSLAEVRQAEERGYQEKTVK